MKQTIRLTESDLKRIVKESVKKVLKEDFTHKRRSVEDFGEPTLELDATALKNELTKLSKYLGMAQGNSKGVQFCVKMIAQISNELKQHSQDEEFNVNWMLQGLQEADRQLSNGQAQSAVKIVNQLIMEINRIVKGIKARPKKWNGGLGESRLHRIVKESVSKVLNEIGDTKRGQWMLGRLKNRQSNGGGKFARGINYNDAGDAAYKANGGEYSDDYNQGFDDEAKYGKNSDSILDFINKNGIMKLNYDTRKFGDMDNIGRKFIDFIEKYHGGVLMQTIVDYESGNQTGKPQSPLGEIVPYFEEEVLGYECTPEMKNAIKKAYNQWWFYAQDQLMPDEEY